MQALPYKDFTIKAPVADFRTIEQRLAEIGASYVGLDEQTDRYYYVAKGKLKWRKGTIENLITHYERTDENGTEKTIVYRYDRNPTQADIAQLQRAHREVGVIEKKRKIFLYKNCKIHLDQLTDGGTFMEIEAIDRNDEFTNAQLQEQCFHLGMQLGISKANLIKTGYWHSG